MIANSLQRCMAVLNGTKADRPPVVPQSFMFAIEQAGMRMSDVVLNPGKMAEVHLRCWEKFGYDGIVIDFDDASMAEACGAKVIFRDQEPAIVDERYPALKNWNDIAEMKVPDPWNDGRLAIWLETTQILAEKTANEVMIMGRADQGPFSIASLLRGTQNFMMELMLEEPDTIHQLIEYARKSVLSFAKAQKDAGAHVTSIGDALAGPNLVSPEIYRQFALQPETRLAHDLQDYGIPFSIHICGNTNAILEDMISTGAKILEIDWQVDMKRALELSLGKCVLMGNVNPSHPMLSGSVNDVSQKVKELIELSDGQMWISTGCAIGRNTPPANFKAMIEACKG